MRLALEQIQTDNAKMKSYICQRITRAGQRVVLYDLSDGPEPPDGEAWAELTPVWDDRDGWDLHVETNWRESVSIRGIYEHFRRQDMTSWEWERSFKCEIACSRLKELELELGKSKRAESGLPTAVVIPARDGCRDLQHAEYLAVKDAAVVVSLSESYVRRKIYARELPAANIGSEARPVWRIQRKDLETWLEARKGGTPSIPPKSQLRDLIQRHLPGL